MSYFSKLIAAHKHLPVMGRVEAIIKDYLDNRIVSVSGDPFTGKTCIIPAVAAVASFHSGSRQPVYVVRALSRISRSTTDYLRRFVDISDDCVLFNEQRAVVDRPTVIYLSPLEFLFKKLDKTATNVIIDDAHLWTNSGVILLNKLRASPHRDDMRLMFMSSHASPKTDVVDKFFDVDESEKAFHVIRHVPVLKRLTREVVKMGQSKVSSLAQRTVNALVSGSRGVLVLVTDLVPIGSVIESTTALLKNAGLTDVNMVSPTNTVDYHTSSTLASARQITFLKTVGLSMTPEFRPGETQSVFDTIVTLDEFTLASVIDGVSTHTAYPMDNMTLTMLERVISGTNGRTIVISNRLSAPSELPAHTTVSFRDHAAFLYHLAQFNLDYRKIVYPDSVAPTESEMERSVAELKSDKVYRAGNVDQLKPDCALADGHMTFLRSGIAMKTIREEVPEYSDILLPLALTIGRDDVFSSARPHRVLPDDCPSVLIAVTALLMEYCREDRYGSTERIAQTYGINLKFVSSAGAYLRENGHLTPAAVDFWRDVQAYGFNTVAVEPVRKAVMLVLYRVHAHAWFPIVRSSRGPRVSIRKTIHGSFHQMADVEDTSRVILGTYVDKACALAGKLETVAVRDKHQFLLLTHATAFTEDDIELIRPHIGEVADRMEGKGRKIDMSMSAGDAVKDLLKFAL